ncbi:cell division ATP-binding protein FtsE [Spongorhabdus nitratireducens]
MILFEGVSKRFDAAPNSRQSCGLEDIDFSMQAGEMAFLTGHSGAGKTTLLRLIALMERPTQGNIKVGGHDLSRLGRGEIPYFRRNIGVVFQDHRLLMDQTIFDNVALPLMIAGYEREECQRRVRAALEMVGLSGREQQLPKTLSGGEQQRVGIARAVVNKPPLLLADEPTGNLDPKLSVDIMRLFENFNQSGVTVLIASHDLSLIARMRHRVLTLEKGRLVNDQEIA